MCTMRPVRAWVEFHSATRAYQLHLRCQACLGKQAEQSPARRWQEQRLYWSCYKSECELRAEMDIPDSLLADFQYPDLHPSPPDTPAHNTVSGATIGAHDSSGPWHPRRSDNLHRQHEQSWFYYLTEITLRRLANRVLNVFYRDGPGGWTLAALPSMIKMAREFESHIDDWYVPRL